MITLRDIELEFPDFDYREVYRNLLSEQGLRFDPDRTWDTVDDFLAEFDELCDSSFVEDTEEEEEEYTSEDRLELWESLDSLDEFSEGSRWREPVRYDEDHDEWN